MVSTPTLQETLCLRCAATEAALPQAEETCFTPLPGQQGDIWAMVEQSIALPTSAVILHSADAGPGPGPGIATLATLSKAGQPVTTETIKALCGGQAPHLWHQKWIEVTPTSTLLDPFDSAVVLTADHIAYDFATHDHAFGLLGARWMFSTMLARHTQLEEDLGRRYRSWLHDGGLLCAAQGSLVVSSGDDEPPCTAIDAPYDLPPAVARLAEEGRRLAEWAFARVTARYLKEDDVPVALRVCPVIDENVLGRYLAEERTIVLPFTVMETAAYQGATPHDRQKILEGILAHEVGHHRHVTAAGVQQGMVHAFTAAYGVPAVIASRLEPLLAEWGLPPECITDFVVALNGRPDHAAFGYAHTPDLGEIVADLYELDHLIDVLPTLRQPLALTLLESVESHLAGAFTVLVSSYQRFSLGSDEFAQLYAIALLDPRLTPWTRRNGAHLAATMATYLAPQMDEVGYDVPAALTSPADRATFTPAELRALERLPSFEEAVAARVAARSGQ